MIPKLLLTLDRKRLTVSDNIEPGQMVLIHTSELRNKHSKAVLAQVTEAKPGRDNIVRVVTLKYFKANSCKLVNNRLVGKPIFITRGVETLSKLNQQALQPCKVTEYLHRNCKADHADHDPVNHHNPDLNVDNLHLEHSDVPHDQSSAPLSTRDLDPDANTTVWIREEDANDNATSDHGKILVDPEEVTIPTNVPPQVQEQEDNSPDIEFQRYAAQQGMPSDAGHQSKDQPIQASGEPDGDHAGAEPEDDTKNDPDFVANKDTPVESVQVRQSSRIKKPTNFGEFVLY